MLEEKTKRMLGGNCTKCECGSASQAAIVQTWGEGEEEEEEEKKKKKKET